MIGIVNYGLSNMRSVAGAVERLGFEYVITHDAELLEKATKLILPGVGAYGDGMKNLREYGLVDILNNLVIEKKKPILGICLGAQLMCKESEEFGHHRGLGWLDASVVRLQPEGSLRVPHVGWNDLFFVKNSKLFTDIPEGSLFYYVHSFYIKPHTSEIVTGESEYGQRFTAALEQENIFATQFHPEKSQLMGLNLLKNFLENA